MFIFKSRRLNRYLQANTLHHRPLHRFCRQVSTYTIKRSSLKVLSLGDVNKINIFLHYLIKVQSVKLLFPRDAITLCKYLGPHVLSVLMSSSLIYSYCFTPVTVVFKLVTTVEYQMESV